MKNLLPPVDDPHLLLNALISSKRGSVKQDLQELLPVITKRYSDYETNKFDLSVLQALTHFTEYQKEILCKCYGSQSDELNKLKATILLQYNEITGGVCQYYTIGEAATFDHYLPKSIFPEFAVLPINLLPCCYKCNNLRSNKWKDNNGMRTTINLYFDNISCTQFLKCKVTLGDNVPKATFFVEQDHIISDTLFKVIEVHFDMLSLHQRFQKKVNTEISEIIHPLLRFGANLDTKQTKLVLLEGAEDLNKQYGVNYWRAVLRKALAESKEFLDSFLNGDLNKNLLGNGV